MKKIVMVIMSLLIMLSVVTATDYDDGYLAGYLDCQNGLENKVEVKREWFDSTDSGNWKINYYVDEFDEPTNNGYISNLKLLEGLFSNSATNDSDLIAYFLIDKKSVAIKLFEYSSYLVTGSSSYPDKYDISVKCNGVVTRFKGTNYSDRIILNKPDAFLDLLKTEQPMKISIALDSAYFSSTYLLKDVITIGFNNAWNSLTE